MSAPKAGDAKAVEPKVMSAPQAVEPKVKVGEKFPDVKIVETPGTDVQTGEVFGKGKIILFGVPGAFTPGCSKTHMPGYVADYDKIKAKGVDFVACVSVNDSFVMTAWQENQKATGKVRCFADPNAALARALGLDKDIPPLGGVRCRRFSCIIQDGVVKAWNVEPDGVPMACSTSNAILAQL